MPAVIAASAVPTVPAALKESITATSDATTTPSANEIDLSALFVADKSARQLAVKSLTAALAQKSDPTVLETLGFSRVVIQALADKKSPAAREGAAQAISAVVKSGYVHLLEPTFIESGLCAALIEAFADKMPAVRTAALDAVREYAAAMNPWATALVMPTLLREIKSAGKWQVKMGALDVLNQLVKSAPVQTARLMPDIVPVLAEAIWDTKADVKKAARDSLTKATALVSNKDIERFIPALIKALINPVEEVPATIALLSATTFVSEVDSPTLSLMVPLLSRGLSEKLTATKRKVAVYVVFWFW